MKAKNYNIRIKRIFFVSLTITLLAFPMQSQVSIGTEIIPMKGALLDLKESDQPEANSAKGMMMARVALQTRNSLSPIVPSTVADGYTGLIVYNVTENSEFEKGLYIWRVDKWDKLNTSSQSGSVNASNGLTSSGIKTGLGGSLIELTTINLANYNLNFNSGVNEGRIGVNVSDPKALLDIQNKSSDEPLILEGVDFIQSNQIGSYFELRASDKGVVRRAAPVVNINQSYVYNLQAVPSAGTSPNSAQVDAGNAQGTAGLRMIWDKGSNGVIRLPESGTFIFSFRLYGFIPGWTTNRSASFYISAFKGNNLYHTQEFIIRQQAGWTQTTYSVNIPVTGNYNEEVYFIVGRKSGSNRWQLVANSESQANRTSMIYWKL